MRGEQIFRSHEINIVIPCTAIRGKLRPIAKHSGVNRRIRPRAVVGRPVEIHKRRHLTLRIGHHIRPRLPQIPAREQSIHPTRHSSRTRPRIASHVRTKLNSHPARFGCGLIAPIARPRPPGNTSPGFLKHPSSPVCDTFPHGCVHVVPKSAH